ncbi:hypothetical protein O1611_g1052 [Lasiodiplodia mahajangana]|uniref:Uncharacterized protein n=1 Tax=Lasiodiplodia mahajangana TaxID=1108764 RepID=A0ACC2JYU1_9PEZI|nr:hypothetical protein O1611_g1052 [Lasiodiplodia mahajangana]
MEKVTLESPVVVTVSFTENRCNIPGGQPGDDYSALLGYDMKYERRTEWYPTEAPFNGEPSPELDEAWDDLLYAINVRLTEDELRRVGLNITNRVQVNGGDYLGSIGIYHHLHCLNNLRMVVHWDYYEKKWADYPFREQFGVEHSDHCINSLRQAVMCHPNTAITTFEWIDEVNALEGKEQKLEAMTTCAKWDSINDWARKKALVKGQFTYRPGPFAANQSDVDFNGPMLAS